MASVRSRPLADDGKSYHQRSVAAHSAVSFTGIAQRAVPTRNDGSRSTTNYIILTCRRRKGHCLDPARAGCLEVDPRPHPEAAPRQRSPRRMLPLAQPFARTHTSPSPGSGQASARFDRRAPRSLSRGKSSRSRPPSTIPAGRRAFGHRSRRGRSRTLL